MQNPNVSRPECSIIYHSVIRYSQPGCYRRNRYHPHRLRSRRLQGMSTGRGRAACREHIVHQEKALAGRAGSFPEAEHPPQVSPALAARKARLWRGVLLALQGRLEWKAEPLRRPPGEDLGLVESPLPPADRRDGDMGDA